MENHSVIDYDILIKRDNSYGYAVANPANKISAKQLAKKAVDLAGVQISPVIAEAIIASAMQAAKNEVAEGNRVYLPCEDGTAIAFYPIIGDSTLRASDRDSEGNPIGVSKENIAARAANWKIRLGAQVATNFGDLTTHASLHFTGKASFIKDGSSQDNGGNNGGNNPDDGMLG